MPDDELGKFLKRRTTDDSMRASIEEGAKNIGIDPVDYATSMSYESAKSFDPWRKGPITKWGQHRGTIQYGEPQQKQYGVTPDQDFHSQVTDSNVRYLKDKGVRPGMNFRQIYAAINGGSVRKNLNTLDANTGRTIADNIANAERDHRHYVLNRFWGGTPPPDELTKFLGARQNSPNELADALSSRPDTTDKLADFLSKGSSTTFKDPQAVRSPNIAESPGTDEQPPQPTAPLAQQPVIPDSTATRPRIAAVEQPIAQEPPVQQPTNADYVEYLKAGGLQDSQPTRDEFNRIMQLNTDVVNKANQQVKASPQQKQPVAPPVAPQPTPAEQPLRKSVYDIPLSNKNGSYTENYYNETATRLSSELNVPYESALAVLKKYPIQFGDNSEAGEDYLAAQAKTGHAQHAEIGADVKQRVRQEAQLRADRQAEFEKRVADYGNDPSESPVAPTLKASHDMGLISDEDFQKKYDTENTAYRDWLKDNGFDQDDRAIAGAMRTQGQQGADDFMAARTAGSADRQAAARQAASDALKQYGSFTELQKDWQRRQDEYKDRPLARPTEFALNIGRQILKTPSYLAKAGAIAGTDFNPLSDTKPSDSPFYQFGKDWEERIDASKNKDFKGELVTDHLANGLGMMIAQGVAAPFTGGASLGLPIAQAVSDANEQSEAGGATRGQRMAIDTVAALAAIPDAVLKQKYLSALNPESFVSNLTKSIFSNLSKRFGEEAARDLTEQTMKTFITQAAQKGTFGATMQIGQQALQNTANRIAQKETYKPEITWGDVFSVSPDDAKGYVSAGLLGVFGGAFETVTGKMSTPELEKAPEAIDRALASKQIDKADAHKLQTTVNSELQARGVKVENVNEPDARRDNETRTEQIVEPQNDQTAETKVSPQPAQMGKKPLVQDKADTSETAPDETRTVTHPNEEINGQPVLAETADGKVVVANPDNKSGVSVVTDRSDTSTPSTQAENVSIKGENVNTATASGDTVPKPDVLTSETTAPEKGTEKTAVAENAKDRSSAAQLKSEDVTPEGYGPEEPSGESFYRQAGDEQTVEEKRLISSLNEGKILLKGKLSPEKRIQIEKSVANTQAKLDAVQAKLKPIQPSAESIEGDYTPRAKAEPNKASAAKTKPDVAKKVTEPSLARFADNKVFTADKVQAARELLKKKGTQFNAGIDPETYAALVTIGAAHVEAGARKFAEFSKAMVEDLGEKVKPHLEALYNTIQVQNKFEGMDAPEVGKTAPDITSTKAGEAPVGKQSKVGKDIERNAIEQGLTEAFGDTAEYTPTTIKEQVEKVQQIIGGGRSDIMDIINGDKALPKDVRGGSFIKGVEEHAKATGDVQMLQALAKSPLTSETSVHAQEMRMLRERYPFSPVKLIDEVQKIRESVSKKRNKNNTTADVVNEIKAEVQKVRQKPKSWADLVDSLRC